MSVISFSRETEWSSRLASEGVVFASLRSGGDPVSVVIVGEEIVATEYREVMISVGHPRVNGEDIARWLILRGADRAYVIHEEMTWEWSARLERVERSAHLYEAPTRLYHAAAELGVGEAPLTLSRVRAHLMSDRFRRRPLFHYASVTEDDPSVSVKR